MADRYTLYFGPQHPGAPGNIGFRLVLEGERIVSAEVIPGFLHRGFEKMLENRKWENSFVLSYRFCVEDPDPFEIAYAEALEKIFRIEPPEKAKYFRMVQGEFSRIASHMFWVHFMAGSVGLRTPAYWALAAREEILKWFAWVSGHRVYHNISVPGGIRSDVPEGVRETTINLTYRVEDLVRDVEKALLNNRVFRARTRGIGVINGLKALELGATGPVVRAGGVRYDTRKAAPYANYSKVEFEIPVGEYGDAYDRAVVRFREVYESLKIIRQAIGEVRRGDAFRVKIPLTAPPGRGYARVEAARGEYTVHVISTGGRSPYRVRLKSPSMPLLTTVLDYIIKNEEVTIADFPVILASLDPCPPDIDR
ncbi:NADH-quinone oxidoreductase subunit D [Thermogladius sp. 4427co]|uniref:NADH-quinone oxidoreductase subunit D n=1 Tax=Thermogladius sp. 4427co TaxID=3450718 RepID=UPI003F797489